MTQTTASVTEATAATPAGSVTRLWSARGCQNARQDHATVEVNTAGKQFVIRIILVTQETHVSPERVEVIQRNSPP